MNKSEGIKKLLGALAKAQQEFEVVRHDEENPYYKSGYASLGAVIASCRPILQKYGLTVIQPSYGVNGEAGVETIIFHAESGEWLSSTVMVALPPNTKKPGEEAGKAITYLRRYSLQSLLGVYSGDDDDLQSSGKQSKKKVAQTWKPETIKAIIKAGHSENDFSVKATLKKSGLSPEYSTKWILVWFKFYRAARDENKTSDEAVVIATGLYKTEVEKAKKGKK